MTNQNKSIGPPVESLSWLVSTFLVSSLTCTTALHVHPLTNEINRLKTRDYIWSRTCSLLPLRTLQQFHTTARKLFKNTTFFCCLIFFFFSSHSSTFQLLDKSRGHRCRPFPPPRFLPSTFIVYRIQQSHCSSIFHRVLLLTHALALSASQFVHKKNSLRIYRIMHSAGLKLTKLTCTRLEDNLIRHRGYSSRYLP